MEILKNPHFDFLGKTRYFVAASLIVMLAGIAYAAHYGLRYGVEFSGGTELILKFTSTPHVDRIRAAVDNLAPGAVIQTYGDSSKNQVLVRLAGSPQAEVENATRPVRDVLAKSYPENPVVESSSEVVGSIVGAELRLTAIKLTGLGLLFEFIYIWVRFKGAVWGAAASVAVLHDVLVTLAFLAFFRYEITLNVIAALLTLVGYSVYDTIVIFDRARENLRHRRKEPLSTILNDSVNQTLTRTLISNGTTFLAVLGLYLFGGEVLRGFGFTMVVGIVVGTYSTIYIATPFVIWWQKMKERRPAAAKAAL
jgi:preprotein translocase subunit SecF